MNFRPLAFTFLAPLVACGDVPPSATKSAAPTIFFDQNDPAGVGVARFTRSADASRIDPTSDRNCADFASDLEAQRFFIASGGPQGDPHDLDQDGDGFACEWGTEVRRRADVKAAAVRQRAEAEAAAAQRRAEAASRCYTGSRGGTYTITAGGYKDYDGC